MVRTKRWLSQFEVARSTPHRAPPHHPTARDKQRFRSDAAPLPPSFPTRRMHCLPLVRVCPHHRVHQPILPQRISNTACPLPPLLSYLVPAHPPTARLCLPFVRHRVCVCAARVSILRVRLRGAPLPLPQARAARDRFPSCLPAPLRAARTKQDPDTCARTRGELGGGGGACKGEDMSHGQELGYGAWPSGWRRSRW